VGNEWEILDSITWLQVDNSMGHLMGNSRRRWTYPPFVPPPLCTLNQEENLGDSEEVKVEEREEEDIGEYMSEEQSEFSHTSSQEILVLRNQTPSSQRGGTSSIFQYGK
jgi:hypothetical protein